VSTVAMASKRRCCTNGCHAVKTFDCALPTFRAWLCQLPWRQNLAVVLTVAMVCSAKRLCSQYLLNPLRVVQQWPCMVYRTINTKRLIQKKAKPLCVMHIIWQYRACETLYDETLKLFVYFFPQMFGEFCRTTHNRVGGGNVN
jgi:hypothetical protein